LLVAVAVLTKEAAVVELVDLELMFQVKTLVVERPQKQHLQQKRLQLT
jgi:hypothetical protein